MAAGITLYCPLPGGVQWSRAGFKHLGAWLGTGEVQARNWEGVVEKVRAWLPKWSWLLPRSRGPVLVLNNLVASALWKFTVLSPPGQLTTDIQRTLVNACCSCRLHNGCCTVVTIAGQVLPVLCCRWLADWA